VIDIKPLLERQSRWQRSRQALTWPEKVRLAEEVRESVRQLRQSARVVEPHSGGFRPGVDPGRLNQLVDQLDADEFTGKAGSPR
jgi:hypothetical protein